MREKLCLARETGASPPNCSGVTYPPPLYTFSPEKTPSSKPDNPRPSSPESAAGRFYPQLKTRAGRHAFVQAQIGFSFFSKRYRPVIMFLAHQFEPRHRKKNLGNSFLNKYISPAPS
jgi:hypothetical protein